MELSRCLQLDDGEVSLEVLPELLELTYSGNGNVSDMFTSFVDARQNAGSLITLIHPWRKSRPELFLIFCDRTGKRRGRK